MKGNQTAYVILGILAIHPRQSGYEIRQTIQLTVGYFWGESFGQIYPALRRLAEEELIVAETPIRAPKKRRQEYSITPAGRACLQQWLAIPYREDPPRDEFLLKLFFARDAAPGVCIAHVRRYQERGRNMLTALLELESLARGRSWENPGFPFWMLTLDFGLAQIRSALEWSESALAVLSAAESGRDPSTPSTGAASDAVQPVNQP